jgi:hypothetical protein
MGTVVRGAIAANLFVRRYLKRNGESMTREEAKYFP